MHLYTNIHSAYLGCLQEVRDNYGFKSAPRGLPIREILDHAFVITKPTADAILTHDVERNAVIQAYTDKEKALYESGTNQVQDFAKASKFWNHLANKDGTVNSAYGYLLFKNKSHFNENFETEYIEVPAFKGELGNVFRHEAKKRTPWEWAVDSLKADKDTRQAVIRFNLPEHAFFGNKDFPCTMHGIFMIRDDKLYLTINMRSNDLVKGLVYDLPWFCGLMDKMLDDLYSTYPNLTKGTYKHIVHSMHIYEKDLDVVNKMLGDA